MKNKGKIIKWENDFDRDIIKTNFPLNPNVNKCQQIVLAMKPQTF